MNCLYYITCVTLSFCVRLSRCFSSDLPKKWLGSSHIPRWNKVTNGGEWSCYGCWTRSKTIGVNFELAIARPCARIEYVKCSVAHVLLNFHCLILSNNLTIVEWSELSSSFQPYWKVQEHGVCWKQPHIMQSLIQLYVWQLPLFLFIREVLFVGVNTCTVSLSWITVTSSI